MINFKTITLADAEKIQNFVKDFEPYSDFNFLSLYSWSLHSQSKYCLEDDALFIMMADYITQKPIYSFLCRNNYLEHSDNLKAWQNEHGQPQTLNLLPEVIAVPLSKSLDHHKIKYQISEDRDSYDYVVDAHKISQAKGKEYSDFRYKLSRFQKEQPRGYRQINFNPSKNSDCQKASRLAQRWARSKKDRAETYEDETYAFNRFLFAAQHHADKLVNVAFEYRGELIAFASCEILPQRMAIAHFLKYDPGYRGIYQALVHRMCAELVANNVNLLNIEQDLGIAGLREAKTHLRPVNFLKKFSLGFEIEN